jgi:ParB family transcriptional regulator, chromosome partitioning protein
MKIKISELRQGAFQTRTKMNGQPMTDLVESIGEVGLAVPIKVRPISDYFEIVYGHRRVEAVKRLGWDEIEAIVEELTDEQAMIQGLAENIQRDDLEPLDEANAYKRLQDQFGYSTRRIAKEVGKSQSRIAQMLALLYEPEEIQAIITKGYGNDHNVDGIKEDHVRKVRETGINAQDKTEVLKKAAREGLTSAQTRKVAEAVKAAPNPEAKKLYIEREYDNFTHDPDRIKELAKKRSDKQDPWVQEYKDPKDKEWRDTPDVRVMIQRLDTIRKDWVPEFIKIVEMGKLDPAGFSFMEGRVTSTINALEKFKETLHD